jgi:sugar phosphate isomerase/epimerase
MKLGFLTASQGDMSAEAVIARACAMGFDTVELAAWPLPLERPFTAAHIGTDGSTAASPARIRSLLDEHGIEVAALAYYDNPLDPDVAKRARVHEHLERVIDWAAEIGCPLVGTFIGRDPGRTVAANVAAAERLFPRFVDRASDAGVRLMIENCPMHGWHPDGYPGNLAYSPELWEWLEGLGLWLNFDPSHLPPLGIDPLAVVVPHLDRIVHVHAKDVAISGSERNRVSCYGQAIGREDPWHTGWWSYRLPGEGDVSWPHLVAILEKAGFEGAISIEHEDEQGPGTSDSILAGVEQAGAFLAPVMDRRDTAAVTERTVGQ